MLPIPNGKCYLAWTEESDSIDCYYNQPQSSCNLNYHQLKIVKIVKQNKAFSLMNQNASAEIKSNKKFKTYHYNY